MTPTHSDSSKRSHNSRSQLFSGKIIVASLGKDYQVYHIFLVILQKIFIRFMKTCHFTVQKSDRLREIRELNLFQKGVTPGDSPEIW